MLHFDELQAECRFKLARIIHNGWLAKCSTRTQALSFVKVCICNHVRSLVQKYAFTEKRTGVKPPPKLRRSPARWNDLEVTKAVSVSLDDEDQHIEVGGFDPAFRKLEFLEELDQLLTLEERHVVSHMMRNERVGSDQIPPPLPKDRFKLVLAGVQAKARAVRDRVG
jgi:hypothetical protein